MTKTKPRRGNAPALPVEQTEYCIAPTPPVSIEVPDDDTLAAMAKAIAHPVRIAILRILAHRETCALIGWVRGRGGRAKTHMPCAAEVSRRAGQAAHRAEKTDSDQDR